MKQIKFNQLTLTNFKSHRDLTVNFGEVTKVTGDNAQGKSSILEAITFLFYGTDTFGSKTDPTPINYEHDETMVTLLFEVDGKQVKLGRILRKGKASYIINDVPSKATEFNQLVDSLFDKELFLSLFNPNYFFTMHWSKQREMLMQYVPAPINKEVFTELPKPQADKLSELVKKHSLNDLEKIHRENNTKQDKVYIAAQSRTKTLKEQLEGLQASSESEEELNQKLAKLQQQLADIDEQSATLAESNKAYEQKQTEIRNNRNRIEMSKDRYLKVRGDEIAEDCPTCRRPLDEKSVATVKENREQELANMREDHNKLLAERDRLAEELLQLTYIERSELHEQATKLHHEVHAIQAQLRSFEQRNKLAEQITEAEQHEQATLTSRNDSIFILDAIKAYQAKEAELQGEKVQGLFETLSIKLFETLKNGEIKPTFEIEMDGKPYSKLSLSESIRAGLELREVLSEQAEIILPTFVDNAESITKLKEPSGQLIMCRVVGGRELEIKPYSYFNEKWMRVGKDVE